MQNVFWISFLHGGGERISANNNLELFGEKKNHKSSPAPLCIHTKTLQPISHPWKGSCCEIKLLDTKSKHWGVVGLFGLFLWAKECPRPHKHCLAFEQSCQCCLKRKIHAPKDNVRVQSASTPASLKTLWAMWSRTHSTYLNQVSHVAQNNLLKTVTTVSSLGMLF